MQLLLALFACLVLPLFASSCAASGRASKVKVADLPAPSEGPGLRVMTFNIQSAQHGLDQVAALIREEAPDVVALQEVDRGTTRAQGLDQAGEIARRAGFQNCVFFKATRLFGGDYGVALLSRYPIVETHQLPLPTPPGVESRAVARVVLDVDGHPMSVYVTHLSNLPRRSEMRLYQARFIARMMQDDPLPKMLLGDFNDEPDSPALLLLKQRLSDAFAVRGRGPEVTYPMPLFLSDVRIDYVLSSPDLSPRDAFVVRKVASDHYPLVAEFALPASPQTAGIR